MSWANFFQLIESASDEADIEIVPVLSNASLNCTIGRTKDCDNIMNNIIQFGNNELAPIREFIFMICRYFMLTIEK